MSAEAPLRAGEIPRRDFLVEAGGGLGSVALAWLLSRDASAAAPAPSSAAPERPGPHFEPRARRIVQVFSAGGVSHVDTFDHKPELEKLHGKKLEGRGELRGFFGKPGLLMKSPFPFRRHGLCGAWVSDLFPRLATCVDDIAFIHSMVAESNNHTPASFQMNTGFARNGFPSMGAWLSYGLGTENENLPTFVVLPDPAGLPAGGSINWTAGFLPAAHQGTAFRTGSAEPVVDLNTPEGLPAARRRASLDLLRRVNRRFAEQNPGDSLLAARLRSYELAARMQTSIPEAVAIDREPESIRRLYGMDREESAGMARNCILARRLLERGVRFVQLFNGGAFGSPRINWDAHESVPENHAKMARTMDRPVSGLLKDLKQRGLLEDTLFVWSTEFGRGPITQGLHSTGRDHHPDAFTCFLAGAGVEKGIGYGASDEIGFSAVDRPVSVHDFHATILHLMGLDHERLTFYHNGIQQRLTNVRGEVVHGVLA